MATLTKTIPNFSQSSTWQCYQDYDEPGLVVIATNPTTSTVTKSVDLSAIPNGSTIVSATLTADYNSPLKGAATRTLDGSTFSGTRDIKSKLDALNGNFSNPVEFVFKFKSKGGLVGTEYDGMSPQPHTSTLTYSNIKVIVEYNPPYWQCGAPTTATLSLSVAESDPTLSCSGAQNGGTNTIIGYEIQYAESSNGSSWGAWTALKTVTTTATNFSTTVTLPSTRGYYRKYRIRTLGSKGSSYYSTWKETGVVRKNSIPTAPTSSTASPSIYESGGITVSWSGATDADNNISSYEVQRATSSDGVTWENWTSVNTAATGSSLVDSPPLTRGQYVKYRIRAKDALGQTSGWKETGVVRRNQVPAVPTINHPTSGKIIYNNRPRILITLGNEPDGQLQSLAASGYTPSSAGSYASGKKLVFRKDAAVAAGSVSFSVTSSDSLGAAGNAASISTTYVAPEWADNIQKDTTRVKAIHINELRDAVNNVRSYYGLSAKSWSEAVEAGTTSTKNWAAHIAELRAAIDDVVNLVNSWDSTATANKITLPTRIPLTGNKPRADVMAQLRAEIALL